MLYLIGLGIWDEKDISLKGIEACRKAKDVYMELYTSRWGGDIKALEKAIGKKIRVLERSSLEDESFSLIRKAKSEDIAILFPGDPLSATTHIALVAEAEEHGIPVNVIHSSSIFTAVAECGLSLYNFGKTVSIPTPQENYSPRSFIGSIRSNMKAGMHTLLLLDIGMPVSQAVRILLEIEKAERRRFLSGQRIIAISGLGSGSQKMLYRKPRELLAVDMGPPAVLIIPGKMHFTEKEFLKRL